MPDSHGFFGLARSRVALKISSSGACDAGSGGCSGATSTRVGARGKIRFCLDAEGRELDTCLNASFRPGDGNWALPANHSISEFHSNFQFNRKNCQFLAASAQGKCRSNHSCEANGKLSKCWKKWCPG